MIVLIDDLIASHPENTIQDFSSLIKKDYWGRPGWMIARPITYPTIVEKIRACILILRNKAFACQYFQDRLG